MRSWSVRSLSTTGFLRYLGGAIIASAVFVALYLFFVRTLHGQTMDQLAYDGSIFGRRSVTVVTQQVLDQVPTVSVVAGAVITGIITAVRRDLRTLVVAIVVSLGAVVTTQVLKDMLLTRPDLGVDGYAGNSFPSGHTTVAAASALAVFLVSSPRTRWLAALLGSGFAAVAGVSTLANGWHRPSDVIAGLLVVAVWGCAGGIALGGWGASARRPRAGRAARRFAAGNADPDAGTGALAPTRGTPAIGYRTQLWFVVPFCLVAAAAFLVTFFGASGPNSEAVIAYVGGVAAICAAGSLVAFVATHLFDRLP
ncbi:phosphatase PAP2 family protein [Cryobacterium breve]|uniref:Phosphatase PAP2 family protein n=1 Tax=Cryobacterium breve TaxID=1259258 RepID=A0ABY7NGP5_9MICO|nr:phosphatase PAP2 family protein [Cryobacterium breve]WBM80932.1 phosphatase PAP2 family protein [Cryobacterium breve]